MLSKGSTAMIRRLRLTLVATACILMIECGMALAGPITITPNYQGTPTQLQKDLFADAIKEWTDCLTGPVGKAVNLTINLTFTDLGAVSNGATSGLKADANGLPQSADMQISTNADMYYGMGLPVPKDKYDALSTMKHEIGHALGFAGGTVASGLGYDKWNALIAAGSNIFDPTGLNVTMNGTDANGRSHLNETKYPTDLMNPTLGTGERRMPSMLDFQMLSKAFGYQITCPEPSTLIASTLGLLSLAQLARRRRAA